MATPLVSVEAADGIRTVFTFTSDIDVPSHLIAIGRLPQGSGIDYTVTGTRQITTTFIPVAGEPVWLLNGAMAIAATSALPSWATVASVISDAAIELGLVATDIADPFTSTDPNILQLLRMLKSAGRDIVKRREWTHLVKEYTFSTVNGTANYGLPSDYRSLVPNSGWNRTTQHSLGGPVGSEYWQFRKAISTAGVLNLNIRIWLGQMYLDPTPSSVQTMAYEYNGLSWVMPSGATAPTSTTPTLASDVVCFDPLLIVKRLKRDYRRSKKQDSQSEEEDYRDALYTAESDDSPGRTIFIGGRRNKMPRQIDRWNIPDTGVGG